MSTTRHDRSSQRRLARSQTYSPSSSSSSGSSPGMIKRLQGLEDIFFGAIGEIGYDLIGNKSSANRAAAEFENGLSTLLGRKGSKKNRNGDPRRQTPARSISDCDLQLVKYIYLEGYQAGMAVAAANADSNSHSNAAASHNFPTLLPPHAEEEEQQRTSSQRTNVKSDSGW